MRSVSDDDVLKRLLEKPRFELSIGATGQFSKEILIFYQRKT